MNVTKSTRVRTKMVKYPYVGDSYAPGPTINFLLDIDQDDDREVADVLRLRDQLTEILESICPGSQRPLPDDEIHLNAGIARFHKIHSIAYPNTGDPGFASV